MKNRAATLTAQMVGRTPGPRGTPSSRRRANDISIMQSASRPTGASAADQGVRPTIPRGWFFEPAPGFAPWDTLRPVVSPENC